MSKISVNDIIAELERIKEQSSHKVNIPVHYLNLFDEYVHKKHKKKIEVVKVLNKALGVNLAERTWRNKLREYKMSKSKLDK